MNDLGKYDYTQVVTEKDLKAMARELLWQRQNTPWYRPIYKWAVGVSLGVILGLIHWVQEGKGSIKNSGEPK